MFTVDSETRMIWFKPGSVEPLAHFELIGVLFSLAVYNGITLPVSFPIVFYHHLLQRNIMLGQVQDGWPQLAKAFGELLTWKDGDVGDIFMRTYEFSFEAFGKVINIDMQNNKADIPRAFNLSLAELDSRNDAIADPEQQNIQFDPIIANEQTAHKSGEDDSSKHTSSESKDEEAALVTNENRLQYVYDYIFWLTYKSVAPQLVAFKRGFYSCFDRKALTLLNPELLRVMVEGHQTIDINALRQAAQYENDYNPSTPIIRYFWDIVSEYSQEMRRKLLVFVTANERVPVGGIRTVTFSIVRNGSDTENLPTASTCFGKLLLPEYNSKEKLEKKLALALEYSQGFGTV
jgi:hypothetical protein